MNAIPRPPTPALDTWTQFRRADGPFDALWRAACWETRALEEWRAEQYRACLDSLAIAVAITREELDG